MASLDKDTPIVLIKDGKEYEFSQVFYLGNGVDPSFFEPLETMAESVYEEGIRLDRIVSCIHRLRPDAPCICGLCEIPLPAIEDFEKLWQSNTYATGHSPQIIEFSKQENPNSWDTDA